jgi:maltokinase
MTDSAAVLAQIEPLVAPFLSRHSWYWAAIGAQAAGGSAPAVSVAGIEVLAEGPLAEVAATGGAPATAESGGVSGSSGAGPAAAAEGAAAADPSAAVPGAGPGLARLTVGAADRSFQLIVGWRDATTAAAVLRGRDVALLGAVPSPSGEVLVYDALADDELLLELLDAASGGKIQAQRVRPVASLTSHASFVYDDRLFVKIYRVLEPAPRPEVEVMMRLDEIGFNYMVAPVALWRQDGYDLALVREFFTGGLEGRSLALTSLRDLLGAVWEDTSLSDEDAARRAGGDFASEMRRLGDTTARLHLALAEAFGAREVDLAAIAGAVEVIGETRVSGRQVDGASLAAQLSAMTSPGSSIRVHGDYHLRRVMRTDVGWIVVGFGDDPSRFARLGPELKGALDGSPLDDIADMCLSIDGVAEEAARTQHPEEEARTLSLAEAWARRNREAFLSGYLALPGVDRLLPQDEGGFEALLLALELVRVHRAGTQ